jgi:hypothetical protein
MPETHLPRLDEVRAAYREGEEAVVKLFIGLVAGIEELEARLNKDSNNNSKPPTSDGVKKRAYARTTAQEWEEERRPGGA